MSIFARSIVNCVFVFFAGCILSCSEEPKSSPPAASTDSSVGGQLSSLSVSSANTNNGVSIMATKTITHVMAVSPATANAQTVVAAVGSDGKFSLALTSGKPYIIVFVAQNGVLTGPNMIVSSVKISANDLDTLPIAKAAAIDLGTVTADGTTGQATPSTNLTTLLTALGVTAGEATYIGAIDDLALRMSNPDVDGNGVIDALEGKSFGMDWHVRSDVKKADTTLLRLSDVENQMPAASDVVLNWTLTSAYAVYPQSFDNTNYVGNSGVDTSLVNGGAFASSGTAVAPTSMSGGAFGTSRQWGPDYNMASQEMGASDAVSTFTYTLGSKTLKYSNVKTKTKSLLNADGVMLPFVKFNTTTGKLTGITFQWKKRSGSTWVDASATEIGLVVQSSGAYLKLYTAKSSGIENGLAFTIPSTSASGTIAVAAAQNTNVSNINTIALSDICMTAMSYDDKMGLRLFAGAPRENVGVTSCP
jgi:hypothetical protein